MQNNYLRVFLCLFMCFVLLLSCVPRPVHAVGVEWIIGQVASDIGVTGILEGLGVFRDSLNGNDYYNNLVSNVKEFLADSGMVFADTMNVWWRIDPALNYPFLTVPLATILAVRTYIFDNGIVSSLIDDQVFSLVSGSQIYSSSTSFNICWYKYGEQRYRLTYSFSPAYIKIKNPSGSSAGTISTGYEIEGAVCTSLSASTIDLDFRYLGQFSTSEFSTYYDCYEYVVKTYLPSTISTSLDLKLGHIAPLSSVFSVAYPQWLEHQRELEDGTTETVVQIGLGNTVGETESLTQEQIWSGQGTLTVPEVTPGTATLTDVISAIVALPGQLVTSITSALTNFFTISGDASGFGIQLKDFFPFCIPFDLFDFLTVLSAEPQAPVFNWEIPVPQLGQTFHLEVDLSAWDSIAAVFRTFELLAFIVGLALITREKFLRS